MRWEVQPEFHELLGQGGVGEVFRVHDPALDRYVALKVLRRDRMAEPGELERFVAEARVTGRLEHPAIVPVHAFGYLSDGRPAFTMKEIKGRTLREAIIRFHEEVDLDPEDQRVSMGFRRLVEQLRRACEAMAYAHERGVVHRDLKPDNILVGPWGEVLVVDWGLSICLNDSFPDMPGVPEAVEGTALYMAPELAINVGNVASPATDVYSMGAILYAILCGRAPYSGSAAEVLMAVARGPAPPPERAGFTIPEDLASICAVAMARDPADRYPDAGVLEAEIGAWLEGALGQEKAWRAVHQAEEMGLMVERLQAAARQLRDQAAGALGRLPSGATVGDKVDAWAMEDEAERLETEAAQCEEEELQLLQAALTHAPSMQDVHERLAAHYHARHQHAEAQRDFRSASRLEVLLRAHNRGRYDSYLKGIGALTLRVEPVDVDVELYRFERRSRQLVPVHLRSLGRTPLSTLELPIGSYQLRLWAPGFAETLLLLRIERGIHHRLRLPGSGERPLRLLREEQVGAGDCYVPSLEPFVVRRDPVTVGEYRQFLTALAEKQMYRAAEELAPRGDQGPPDFPVVGVDWEGVRAFSAWQAVVTGHPWRPLREREWERLIGADGRRYPWGDFLDPSFCAIRESSGRLQSSGTFVVDESPYGPRDLVGNVREWCAGADGPVLRGSSFLTRRADVRMEAREERSSSYRALDLGFRIAWSP